MSDETGACKWINYSQKTLPCEIRRAEKRAERQEAAQMQSTQVLICLLNLTLLQNGSGSPAEVSFLLCRTLGEQVCFPGLLREATEKHVKFIAKADKVFSSFLL